jgi:arsenite-transporting ATPase
MTKKENKTRIILFTGKGGVGKTSCAAASAIKAVKNGKKTLIISSDPAHSLSDALDTELGPEPVKVRENLYAQEIDLYYSMKKYWGNVRELLLLVFKWQGINEIAAEELAAIPGMEEASALLWLEQYYNEQSYDVIIVDSAPTGETLTFLTLPQITEWWLTKAFPFQQTAIRTVGFAVRKTTGVPVDRGYAELQELLGKLKMIHEVLCDPTHSSIRLVMNPERMVIQETKRAYTYLQMYGYHVDCIIINRIINEKQLQDSDWKHYISDQKKYLDQIQLSFSPLPILKAQHQKKEVFGIQNLEKIGEELYGKEDPSTVLYNQKNFEIFQEDDIYKIRWRMPFLDKDDFSVHQFADQLVIQVKNQRRNYFLPKFLSYYQLSDHTIEDDQVIFEFQKEKEEVL